MAEKQLPNTASKRVSDHETHSVVGKDFCGRCLFFSMSVFLHAVLDYFQKVDSGRPVYP